MLGLLQDRCRGSRSRISYGDISTNTKETINGVMNQVCTNLDELRSALVILHTTPLGIIKENAWNDIEQAMTRVSDVLLEHHQIQSGLGKKQEREVFISIGGGRELLKLFEYPFNSTSSTIFVTTILRRHADIWNIALVTLRELCATVSTVGDSIVTTSHIVFLFNLLAHSHVFENTLQLLEEILATRSEVFSLRNVPNIHNIIKVFTTRQLSHFCRVLALLLFEPEDRQNLEGGHSLRSVDLIQLRRDKLSKPSYVVERNQSLVVEMPGLLARLVGLLRITVYAPNLKELIAHQIMAQLPIFTYEVLYHMLGIDESESDWEYFTAHADAVDASLPPHTTDFRDAEDVRMQGLLLQAFTPNNMQEGSAPAMDMTNILSVIHAANQLGVGTEHAGLTTVMHTRRLTTQRRYYSRARRTNKTLREIKNELLFQSMVLVPHQIEIIFVLLTLLSGRRKLFVQDTLLELNLPTVLQRMFHRMSWEATGTFTSNPFEHIHGPSCECNPESALRVQYLRLVHNLYDRDFVLSPNKQSMLSAYETSTIAGLSAATSVEEVFVPPQHKGLLSMIIAVLVKEPIESLYRFWLSSCVEAFLRGNRPEVQLFVARCGLMSFLVDALASTPRTPKTNLQTIYDLLGELIKNNRAALCMFESLFTHATWTRFTSLLLSNLVDSNVFLRSLFMTIGSIELKEVSRSSNSPTVSPGYCSHSWVHTVPISLVSPQSQPTSKEEEDCEAGNERMSIDYEHDDVDVGGVSREMDSTGFERLYEYVQSNKETIIFKLVSVVTVLSVNHENICCVNSALVALLHEMHRGTLQQCLDRLRDVIVADLASKNNNRECSSADVEALRRDNAVLRNFRTMLWYWTEYYLRRGRDRLSLEFSSCRIPVSKWIELVELLCADDGSACALLQQPTTLPLSPYSRHGKRLSMGEF